jgi:phosphatidylserine/phosphatidylglycerophosphate/cardiolipin synthase-like enzyme
MLGRWLKCGLVAWLAFASVSCRLLRERDPWFFEAPAVSDVAPQGGPVRAYFSTPGSDPYRSGNIAERLADYIDQTQETIDVAAYELDNTTITEALLRAVGRGVKVRLVTDSDYRNESGVSALRAQNVPIVEDGRGALMHHKFMVFDRRAVWTGSMNFTENCAYRNNNHGLLIVDDGLAENYSTKFRWMFELKKFGGRPTPQDQIPFPQVVLTDGTGVRNYFSTHDDVGMQVVEEIRRAKESIHFLAFSFTHKAIGEAMLEARQRGVRVSGVFEETQAGSKSSWFRGMKELGCDVLKDGNPRNMHHKCIVIDGGTVIAGSFNFSASADNSNDENLVMIRNRRIAGMFQEEFVRVRETAIRNP